MSGDHEQNSLSFQVQFHHHLIKFLSLIIRFRMLSPGDGVIIIHHVEVQCVREVIQMDLIGFER